MPLSCDVALKQLATTPWPQEEKAKLRRGEKSLWMGKIFQSNDAYSKDDLLAKIIEALVRKSKTALPALKVISRLDQPLFLSLLQIPQERALKVKLEEAGPVFYIAKEILQARPYFRALEAFKEGQNGQVVFKEEKFCEETFKALIGFLYSEDTDYITQDNAQELLELAD
jgi:hypothetical protein